MKKITKENVYIRTIGDFTPINAPNEDPYFVSPTGDGQIPSKYWIKIEDGKEVGIIRQADHWGQLQMCNWTFEGRELEDEFLCGYCAFENFQKNPKKIVLVDVDGTIAMPTDRLKFLEKSPPDYASFHKQCDQDEPIHDIIQLVEILSKQYLIVYCTGRPHYVREKTQKWIALHTSMKHPRILMRSNSDTRHDIHVKQTLLDKAGILLDDIYLVLEDRNSMVKKWRELGLRVLHVEDREFGNEAGLCSTNLLFDFLRNL